MPTDRVGRAIRCILAAGILGLAGAKGPGHTPAQIEGPIPASDTSHPFLAAAFQEVPVDLKASGYIEREYFLRGRANVYQYGKGRRVEIRSVGVSYVNRVIVRLPANPARFNGRVLVELLNPSLGVDLSDLWALSHGYLMHEGYGYVGITSKPVNVAALKRYDPRRYTSMAWPNPLPGAAACIAPHPVAPMTGHSRPETEDGLIWDMLTQLAALLRSREASNPLGRPASYLYAFGYSQTGGYVGTYATDFQPHERLPGGKPPFDGFIQGGSAGPGRLNQCSETLANDDPHSLIRSATPFIRLTTMTDYIRIGPFENWHDRRADSDAPDDRFRLYEVAGAAHVTLASRRFAPSAAEYLRAGISNPYDCVEPVATDFPLDQAFNMAIEALDGWARLGRAPPHAPRLAVDRERHPDGEPVLDSDGNALGGLRLPAIEVPVAVYTGRSTGRDLRHAASCRNEGHKIAFTPARLRQFYPGRADYVAKVERSVARAMQARWLTAWDGARIVAQARREGPSPGIR